MEEIWKDIKNYEGLYQVSNLGRVRSLYNTHRKLRKVPKILKYGLDGGGYQIVILYKNCKAKGYKVHRLVWEAFIDKRPEGMEINHIDENPQNNVLTNLNLLSPKANCNWGTRNKRIAKSLTNHPKKSKSVIQKSLEGEVIKIWPSAMEIQRELGYSQAYISNCCIGKFTKAYGYIWEYEKAAS